MDEYQCKNKGCNNSCSVRMLTITKGPQKCLMTGNDQEWEKVEPPKPAPTPTPAPEPHPILTDKVFDLPECPEWALYAAVDSDGAAYWFNREPHIEYYYDDGWDDDGWDDDGSWASEGSYKEIPGEWNADGWKDSKIRNFHRKMEIRFKKLHPDAKAPYQGTPGSAGWDLTAVACGMGNFSGTLVYSTGIAVEIPEGHVGLVFPRSSVYKTGMTLTNCVGVIDSDYRGEITAVFKHSWQDRPYNAGDRIAQLVIMPIPAVEFVEAEELTETERGAGGYGSTGK